MSAACDVCEDTGLELVIIDNPTVKVARFRRCETCQPRLWGPVPMRPFGRCDAGELFIRESDYRAWKKSRHVAASR